MADHPRRLFSEIMATGLEKTMDEAECSIFSDSRKNLSAAFKKSVTNVEAGEEHMKCYLRIRPFCEDEKEKGEDQECLEILDDNTVMTKAPKESHSFKNHAHGLGKTSHKFTFSRIFDEETSQKEFFDDTMLGLVRDFIDGQNCLVFTYGVTSSGKTYTIQGKQSDAGILPRALDVLFNSINNKQWSGMNLKPKMFMDVTKLTSEQEDAEKKIKERIMKMSTEDDSNVMMLLGDDASDMSQGNTTTCSEGSNISTVDREPKDSLDGDLFTDIENRIREETKLSVEDQGQIKFSIWCSFAEIYNEQIFDLLEPLPKKKNAKRPVLRLSDDKNGSPYIKGLKEVNVFNADEAYRLLNIGQRNLRTACTKLNHNSSRSHCIFNIKIIRVLDNGNPRMARVSMLSLCDLAGSERSSKTLSQGERLKEAGNINTSLMTLGRCIEMLRYNQNHKENSRIIPFRDSKLTRLFQNFFCGRGKAAMIVNVNQCASMFDETFHVFKFSAIAKQLVVHQKPEVKKPICMSTRSTRARDPSIMWDTPGAMMKYNSQFAHDEDDEDDDDDGLDVSMSELQEALNLVELLQNQLTEEKRTRVLMEAQVRDEVCKEMMQQIVSIEENYNEMLRETKIQQEEKVEERVKMLMQSIHRPRKRLRGDKSDENTDEWVPIIRLQAEEIKVKELTIKLESMTKEIATMKAEMKQMAKAQETMTKTKTSLEFQIADSKSTITELLTMKEQFETRQKVVERENKDNSKVIDDLKLQLQQALASRGQSDDVGSSVLLETLSQQLQEAKDTIRQQEKDIEELNEMLTEAGETFNQKDEEIVKLKIAMSEDEEKIVQQAEMITRMQTMLEESKMAVEDSQQRLQDKDAKLSALETTCSDKQEMIEKLTRQLKRLESAACDDMEKSRIEERENLQKMEAEMEKLNEVLIDKEAEIVSLNDKLKKEEEESFKRHQALIHGYNAEMNIYKSHNLELRAKLAGFKKTDDELEKTKEQAKSFKNDLLDQVKELQDELMKNSAMTAELERGLTIAKSSVEDLEKRLEIETRKHTEAKKVIGDFDSKLKKITDEKEEKILHHKKNARTLRGEVNDLKDTLKTKENDLENIKFKFAELEIVQEKTIEDKTKVAEELDRVKELVKEKDKCLDVQAGDNKSVTKMNDELEKLKKLVGEKDKNLNFQAGKMEKMNKIQEELNILKKKEDSMNKTIREKDTLIDELKKEVDELKNKISELTAMADKGKEELKTVNEEMEGVMDSLKSKDEIITNLEEKLEELETVKSGLKEMVNQTTGDLENKTVQLKNLEAKTEDLNKLTCLEKQLTGEISKLNLQIEEKNKNIRKIEKDLEMKNSAFEKLKIELDKQKSLIEEKNKNVKEFEKDIELKSSDFEKLKTKLDNQNLLIEEKNKTIKELQKDLELKNSDSKELKTELESKSEEINKLNTKISHQTEKIEQLNEKFEEESKNSGSKEQKIAELTETISQQTQLLEHKIKEIDTLKGELEEKVSECENLNFKLTTAQTELGDIRVVLEGLKEQETSQQEQTQIELAEVSRQKQVLFEKLTTAENREKDLLKHEEELQEKLKSSELEEKEFQKENESLKSQVKLAEDKQKELIAEKEGFVNTLETSEKSVDCLKEEKTKLCEEIKRHKEDRTGLNKQIEKLQHDLEEKTSQLEEVQASYLEMKNTLSKNDTKAKKLTDAHLEIAELKSALHMEKTLHKKYKTELDSVSDENKELHSQLSKKNDEVDLLKTEEMNFEKEIVKLTGKLKEEKSSRQEAIEKLQLIQNENKKERSSTSETLATKEGEIRQLSKELNELKTVFSEAQQECSDLAQRNADLLNDSKKVEKELKATKKQDNDSNICQQLREELEREQTRCIKLEASIKEYQDSETDTTPGNARRLRKEKIQAESSLINAEFEIEKLTKKLQAMERGENRISPPQTDRKTLEKLVLKDREMEKLSEQIKSLQSKVSSLTSELENVEKRSSDSSSINKEVAELKTELKEKEQKIYELSRKKSTESLKMSEDSLQELKKSQERELNLRQQLKEAGETMKEQNKEISDLEEKVQNKLKEFLEMESKIKHLEKEKDDLMSQSSASRVHEEKIQELRSEIERKNQKLESKHKTNTELRQTLTVEREKFEVALKDAQANEAVLESLKDALSEQEDTMAKQDEILKKREDEIKLLNSELEKLTNKYQNLLDSTGDSGREIRELTKCNTKLESEKKDLEKERKTLKEELEKHDKTIQDSENRITDLTNQISALQTNKDKMDVEIDKNAEEMSQFLKDLERLKTEKVDLEKLVCVNKNRSNNLEEILSAKSTLENEKRVLQKERDELLKENEKLISDKATLNNVVKENNEDILELEKVLTESRQQVEELKCKLDEQVKEKVNNEKQETKNLVEELKSRLRDKDGEIRKLQKELGKVNSDITSMKNKVSDKEKEMETWRKSRDDLVGSLESLMKKQAAEIKDLKEERLNHNRKEMLNQLEEKDEKIRELEEQLDAAEVEVKVQTPTRGRCRKRSNIAGISIVEIDNMRKQLEQEREEKLIMQRNLQMMQKAKDSIISDMRTSNHLLQVEIAQLQGVQPPPTPPPPTPPIKTEPIFEEEDEDISDHVQLDATPTVATKALRKGRKRVSATPDADQVPKTRRRGRPATKIKQEQEEPASDLVEIKEEEEESDTGRRPGRRAKKAAKDKIGEALSTISSPITRSAKNTQPVEMPETPTESESKLRGRKKRVLYNAEEIHITPPFECGAFVPSNISPDSKPSARQLRGRKQSAV